ncbi:MAG: zinc-ribbon domain-containing protein [Rhodospirillaceae bacterium]|nr:zinc-ribbon domain-containing protein [Rhodospirillaceae bacterium]
MSLVKCPECGKDVSDAATSCPNCGHPIHARPASPPASSAAPATEKMRTGKKAPLGSVGAFVALIIVGLLLPDSPGQAAQGNQAKIEEGTQQTQEATQQEQAKIADEAKIRSKLIATAMTPKAIWSDFNANEVGAENKYKDKVISIKGKINIIRTDIAGDPMISFSVDRYGLNTIQCVFSSEEKGIIGSLSKGQRVIVSGTINGTVMGSIFVRGCHILKN